MLANPVEKLVDCMHFNLIFVPLTIVKKLLGLKWHFYAKTVEGI